MIDEPHPILSHTPDSGFDPTFDPTFDKVVRINTTDRPEDFDPAPDASVMIEDVARMAGVAPITVSRAIRTPGKVSADKRERIQAAIALTGYRPDPIASAMRSGRTNIVLGVVSNLFSQQFAAAMRGCSQVLEKSGYQFLIGQTAYSYSRETSIIAALQPLKPAAVLFTSVIELQHNRERLRALNIPVMETWAYPPDPIDMLVGFSNTDGGRMAAAHLSERGYRKLAFIGRRSGRGALRLHGFETECQRLGLEIHGKVVYEEVQTIADGRTAFAQLMQETDGVDAIFCANDLLAIGALLEARDRGLKIPEDIAIIGFGENDMASALTPGLTTIGFDSLQLGRQAGEMLLAELQGEKLETKAHHVELFLTERGST